MKKSVLYSFSTEIEDGATPHVQSKVCFVYLLLRPCAFVYMFANP